MADRKSTREKLLELIDDVELIAKELLENIIAPKTQRLTSTERSQLAELLVAKDEEIKRTLVTATRQAEVQKTINALQEEVEKQDHDIHLLQRHLKEAEHLLSTAIYQAKQKLQSIEKANARCVSSEELIKYAHRISASNAVAAPHNWQQGDQRRPYPTDIEMRQGFLGRLSDLPLTGAPLQQQGNLGDLAAPRGHHTDQNPLGQAFSWQIGGDIKPPITSNHNSVSMDAKTKESEDVEVMSTDSSSSSSSDSQ
ncbi:mediator of RNA polymerase II transcription subunit 4-like [Ornithodoros turicata]|uniref:mediator of RNA polymerase II transcription subunit 4-like n=1 Tax=Ornithodoros turicata TaxID=34597 RepID=UPI00313A1984